MILGTFLLASVAAACGARSSADVGETVSDSTGSGGSGGPGSGETADGGDDTGGVEPEWQSCAEYPRDEFEGSVYPGIFPEEPSGFAGRCRPSEGHGTEELNCCSTDPRVDGNGVRYFHRENNALSRWGECVVNDSLTGFPGNCPLSCDPTAGASETEATCGYQTLCCAVRDTPMGDCVYDPALSCYRPGTVLDVGANSSVPCPNAELAGQLEVAGLPSELARCGVDSFGDYASAQDPDGSGCDALASQGIEPAACLESRTLTHQRGFCLVISATVQSCPLALSNDQKIAAGMPLDGCSQINAALDLNCG